MLEIACFELTSAETALKSVADRIEFCANHDLGGTTPNFYEFLHLKRHYAKPVYVMIRPEGGPFFYSDEEFLAMKNSIIAFKEGGADAILQISHGGRQANAGATGLQCVGPSAIPCKFVQRQPRALSKEELLELIAKLKNLTDLQDCKLLEQVIRNEMYHYHEVHHDCICKLS